MTEEDAITAGELALGLLDGDEKAAALRRVIADPAFAREVERWRARLAALHAAWPEAEPGPAVEQRVARIGEPNRDGATRWRWLAGLSSAAAAALLVALLTRPSPAPVVAPPVARAAPTLVAVFKPSDGDPFGAIVDPRTREVRFSGAVATPAGRDAELWAIGNDGVPRAAGLLPPARRLSLAPALPIEPGTTLAISIEPVGGSPKPIPTGPVVATGKLIAI